MSECKHPTSKLVVRSGRYVDQCSTCGAAVGTHRKGDLTADQQARAGAWDSGASWRYQRSLLARESGERKRRDAAWWSWYGRYLQSSAWKLRRRRVLERCHNVCEGCGEAQVSEIHHLTYAHVGCEYLWELRGVCDACHSRLHAKPAGAPASWVEPTGTD